jgi:hypothetical protein
MMFDDVRGDIEEFMISIASMMTMMFSMSKMSMTVHDIYSTK